MVTPMAGGDHVLPCFTLSFRPSAALVSAVRRFVADAYEHWLSPELTDQLALASHELLENAVLHSCDDEAEVHLEVTPFADGQAVCIRTRNAASAENLDALRTLFAELDAAADPDAHYLEMMRRSAKRTDGSGLGLARIRAETIMTMMLDITDGRVSISARLAAQGGQP
jgi:hypothetical protein